MSLLGKGEKRKKTGDGRAKQKGRFVEKKRNEPVRQRMQGDLPVEKKGVTRLQTKHQLGWW